MNETFARTKRLQQYLKPGEAILLSTPADLIYFSGFLPLLPEEREGFFFVTANKAFLIQATFSPTPENRFFEVLENCRPEALSTHIKNICQTEQVQLLFFDPSSLFFNEFTAIKAALPDQQEMLKELDRQLIWNLRITKDALEIQTITRASQLAKQAADEFSTYFEPGVTELELAQKLELHLRKSGAHGLAFPTIVAFGEHTALPHHQPGTKKLEPEMPVLLDLGARYQHYRSDMTRTYWYGHHPDQEFQNIEKIVLQAYQDALAQLYSTDQQHVTAKMIDDTARKVIQTAEYSQFFIHTTGHGVGLDLHEPPSINARNHTRLTPNMVITIEPGIYFAGKFGYRYENTVLLTNGEPLELTR